METKIRVSNYDTEIKNKDDLMLVLSLTVTDGTEEISEYCKNCNVAVSGPAVAGTLDRPCSAGDQP